MADDEVNEVPSELSFVLPRWALAPLEGVGPLPDVHARMALVLQLAEATVANSSGGPFAAVLFTLDDGRGSRRGSTSCWPRGRRWPTPRSSPSPWPAPASAPTTSRAGPIQLVTSCEPCAMCMGALPWPA